MSNTQLGPSKEEIRVLAAAVGQREAARQLGISENTVKSICYRSGDGQRVAVAVAAKQQNSLHPNAPSTVDAVANVMANRNKATKLGLAGYAARMAKQAHTSGVLEEAPLYKAVADIASKVWPDQQQAANQTAVVVSVNILGGADCYATSSLESPVIDQE